MFWRRKNDQGDDGDTAALDEEVVDEPVQGELVPIRIFTGDEVIDGWTKLGSHRLSDILNAEDVLRVSRVDEAPSEGSWMAIEREQMLLVVAPPHISPRQLRVHRRKLDLRARSAHYAIRGTVHTIPGSRIDRTVLRTRQHFLPITDARLVMAHEPNIEELHQVVLINVVDAGEDLNLELAE